MRSVVLGLVCMLSASGAAAQAPSPNQPVDISGIYILRSEALAGPLKTVEGKDPPFRPEAKALYEHRMSLANTPHPWADSEVYCLPPGMPRISVAIAPFPIQILQTPGQVTFFLEAGPVTRFIYLDRDHPADLEKTWNGHAVGHWEGDTLVVDTVGLNGKGSIDKRGMPMSDAMHVVERIRKIDANTLENLITIDDPKIFTAPWTTRSTYRRLPADTEIQEYVCENNRTVMDAEGRQHLDFGPAPRP